MDTSRERIREEREDEGVGEGRIRVERKGAVSRGDMLSPNSPDRWSLLWPLTRRCTTSHTTASLGAEILCEPGVSCCLADPATGKPNENI